MLVVGDHDINRLLGHEKSSKQRKVDEPVVKGTPTRVLKQDDLQELATRSAWAN